MKVPYVGIEGLDDLREVAVISCPEDSLQIIGYEVYARTPDSNLKWEPRVCWNNRTEKVPFVVLKGMGLPCWEETGWTVSR